MKISHRMTNKSERLLMSFFRQKPPHKIDPQPGQESVWDYPRPPRLEPVNQTVRVAFGGQIIAESVRAYRVLETASPPTYYIPPEDVKPDILEPTDRVTICEWKGRAKYWTVRVGDRVAENAAWSYPTPTANFAPIQDYLSFYARPMDSCYVGEDKVDPQAGSFYGGWVTPNIVGPFKGEPGTQGW